MLYDDSAETTLSQTAYLMVSHNYHGTEALDAACWGTLVGAVHIYQPQGVRLPCNIDCCIAVFFRNWRPTCQFVTRKQPLQHVPAVRVSLLVMGILHNY